MSTHTPTQVTALAAQAAANRFLSEHLPDRFTADQAERDRTGDVWHVPVILAYPFIGAVGKVGEILISVETEQIVSSTALDEMKSRACLLYEAGRDEIENQNLGMRIANCECEARRLLKKSALISPHLQCGDISGAASERDHWFA